MLWVIVILLILALFYLPSWWVKRVLSKYSTELPELPGTGGQLATHLVNQFSLPVTVETTDQGDHYDPETRTVRLSEAFYQQKSLAAVAVAAHEVGHAIQHHRKEKLFTWRIRLSKWAIAFQKIAVVGYFIAPLTGTLIRSPGLALLIGGLAVSTMLLAVFVQVSNLPVEWDASFGKALPILQQGEYITEAELPIVRKVLTAAALTYVAAALASMLNIWRWLAILRR